MENKIKIGIGFLVVVIIVLIASLYLQKDNINTQEHFCESEPGFLQAVDSKNFESCNGLDAPDCMDYCRFKIAAFSENPVNCEKIQNIEHKDLCYRYLSISLKDISLCAKQSESNAAQSKSFCETLYYEKYGWPQK